MRCHMTALHHAGNISYRGKMNSSAMATMLELLEEPMDPTGEVRLLSPLPKEPLNVDIMAEYHISLNICAT